MHYTLYTHVHIALPDGQRQPLLDRFQRRMGKFVPFRHVWHYAPGWVGGVGIIRHSNCKQKMMTEAQTWKTGPTESSVHCHRTINRNVINVLNLRSSTALSLNRPTQTKQRDTTGILTKCVDSSEMRQPAERPAELNRQQPARCSPFLHVQTNRKFHPSSRDHIARPDSTRLNSTELNWRRALWSL